MINPPASSLSKMVYAPCILPELGQKLKQITVIGFSE